MKRPNEVISKSNKRTKFVEKYQELGIIESVCLKNFMCHDHLKFDFDPHINFIIGQNGSGKSAILTGIILALGGKSSTTGRYANIRGFIKTGKQKAYLSVVLKNCGDFAFKPESYGNKIIIEREISIDGGSVYKLKSSSGRLVSNLKEELNSILNAMDIQIENPVLVLTQETSRNFLMSKHGREEKLYEFYYKGTGLQLLEDNYKHAKSLKDDAVNELALKKQALPRMEKEVERYKKLDNSTAKLKDLRLELLWANVTEMEKRLEESTRTIEKVEKNLSINKKESESCKNAYNKWCLTLEQYLKEKTECDSRMAIQRRALSELSAQRDTCADNVRKFQGILDLHKRQEGKQVEDIARLEESIKETELKNQSNFDEQRRERDEQIQRLEAENSRADARQDHLKKESDRLYKEQNKTRQEIDSLTSEMNSFEYKKSSLIKDMQFLKNAVKNRQLLFGEHTSTVLNEIKRRSHEFIKVPKGPIGLFVEVKDQKWNAAVEACLKPNILRSFCCDNADDSTRLTQILSSYYRDKMPSVIVSKYLQNVHNVSEKKARSNYPTVFDMLSIQDPVIANCLIDQLGIENIILIEEITEAQSIMLDQPPRNCHSAFLLNCDEILVNPYRHYSATRKPTNSMLQSVDQNDIRSMEKDYRHVTDEIQKRRNQRQELQQTLQKYPNEIKKLENEFVKLTALKGRNLSIISDLRQYEDPKDVSGMQDDLVSLKVDLEKKRQEVKESEQNLKIKKLEYDEIYQKLQQQKESLQKEKTLFDELGRKINMCSEKKEILATSKKEFESSVKNCEKELKQLELSHQEIKRVTQKAVDDANGMDGCARICTDRSIEEIRIQLEETEKVIETQSDCDRGAIKAKYLEKYQKLKQAKIELTNISGFCKKLDGMLNVRERKLKEIKKHTEHCLDLGFSVVLKYNGFVGHLDFSKPGHLRLEATPRQENPDTGGQKQCCSLSGGERSFVTISFLLALWDRIKMPFRILDEYDVFMDSNNRNLSINLLIGRADFMKNVQFIFLSPLELPEMRESDNIKVHKMPAPKRIGLTNTEENTEE